MSSSIPRTSGVYKIVCLPTNKVYVGSANDLLQRRREHWADLRHDHHCNQLLQNAWNKYGESAFVFEVVELVLESFVSEREQFWMDKLHSFDRRKGFNIIPAAAASWGRKHSEETKAKISDALRGRRFSESERRLRRESQTNNWKSPDYQRKMSDAHARHWIVTDPDGNEHAVFNLERFCREHGLERRLMSAVAYGRNGHRSHRGWKCRRER